VCSPWRTLIAFTAYDVRLRGHWRSTGPIYLNKAIGLDRSRDWLGPPPTPPPGSHWALRLLGGTAERPGVAASSASSSQGVVDDLGPAGLCFHALALLPPAEWGECQCAGCSRSFLHRGPHVFTGLGVRRHHALVDEWYGGARVGRKRCNGWACISSHQ